MDVPAKIAFHNIEHSDAVETRVRERIARLEQFFPHITSCHVAIEAPHRSPHPTPDRASAKPIQYHVRIDVHVPGRNLTVSRNPGADSGHYDIYVALRDSFDAMERQIEDFARRQKNKSHEPARAARQANSSQA